MTPTIFAVRAKGPLALFCSPWLRAEPHSEPVMTPSAAAGLLRSLYRKPEFEWVVRAIHVLAPIRFETIRRKAITTDYNTSSYGQVSSRKAAAMRQPDQTLQTQTCLRDVDYVIEAEISLNPTETRNQHEVERIVFHYLASGSVFGTPCGGRAEFPLDTEFLGSSSATRGRHPEAIYEDLELGPVLLGMSPVDTSKDLWDPVYVRLRMEQGVVCVPRGAYDPLLRSLAEAALVRRRGLNRNQNHESAAGAPGGSK